MIKLKQMSIYPNFDLKLHSYKLESVFKIHFTLKFKPFPNVNLLEVFSINIYNYVDVMLKFMQLHVLPTVCYRQRPAYHHIPRWYLLYVTEANID